MDFHLGTNLFFHRFGFVSAVVRLSFIDGSYARGAGVGRGEPVGVGGGVRRGGEVGRGAGVGRGLGEGVWHGQGERVEVGVAVGVAVAVAVGVKVGVGLAVGVDVGLGKVAQYLPPVFVTIGGVVATSGNLLGWWTPCATCPPHTIILLPVQTAV